MLLCVFRKFALMIKFAETKSEMMECFDVLSPLRPHLNLDEFLSSVERMSESTGYKIAYLVDIKIRAVAGIRISE